MLFARNCDANEYARTTQPAAKALGVLLNTARWLGKGKPPERVSVEPVAASVAPIPADKPPAAKEENQPVVFAAEEEPRTEPELLAKDEIDEPVFSLAANSAAPETEPPPIPPRISAPEVPIEIGAEEIAITLGDRRYQVRGLAKNLSYDLIKINLLVSRSAAGNEAGFHVDTLDLYAARQRIAFAKQAAIELGMKEEVIRHDLGHVLRKLEEIQQEQIRKALEPKREEIAIADKDRGAALELLRDPRLMDRIVEDLARCGVVGEEANKKTAILAAVSRLFDAPLAVVVQSSSAAGQKLTHGLDPGLRPSGAPDRILGHDGAVALLHGRDGPETQGARHRRGRRREPRDVCAEAPANEGVLTIASHGQRPGHRQAGDTAVPCRRSGDDLSDDDGYRDRRRTAEPVSGPDSQRRP